MLSRRNFLKKTAVAGGAGLLLAKNQSAVSGKVQTVPSEKVLRLHRSCLIIDGHNDTPVERMTARDEIPMKWQERDLSYQSDLPRMREGGQQYVAFMIISAGRGTSPDAFRNFKEMVKQTSLYPDDILQVLKSDDAHLAGKTGRVGVISAIEGGWGPLDGNADNLKKFYDMGLRLAGISHGEGGSDPKYLQGTWSIARNISPSDRKTEHQSATGLTSFGLTVLKLMNDLRIITDLSHINDKAYFDVMEKSQLVPVVSHTAAYSLCQHGRCITDDQIRALAGRGGVMGITFVPDFLDNNPGPDTLERFIDHISYVADLVGTDHVGVGTDYDGGVKSPTIPDVSCLVELTRGMMNRGFSDREIRKIWGGNFLRVMREVWDVKKV